jgi:DNA-binding NarL/FixJ family response regulator
MITVLLVADDPVVRARLCDELAGTEDLVVVGEAVNGREATVCLAARPDVVLIDVSGSLNGAGTTRWVLRAERSAIVVVLAPAQDPDRAMGALLAGAHGYVASGSAPGVAAALRSAATSLRSVRGRLGPPAAASSKAWARSCAPTRAQAKIV